MDSLLRVEHVTISYNGKPISAEKVDDLTLNITLQEPNSAFETSPEAEKVPLSRQSWDFWEKKVWLQEVISGTKVRTLQT